MRDDRKKKKKKKRKMKNKEKHTQTQRERSLPSIAHVLFKSQVQLWSAVNKTDEATGKKDWQTAILLNLCWCLWCNCSSINHKGRIVSSDDDSRWLTYKMFIFFSLPRVLSLSLLSSPPLADHILMADSFYKTPVNIKCNEHQGIQFPCFRLTLICAALLPGV